MKIFQLIHWLTKLFKLNNRSKIILLILLPLPIFSQNNAAFWLGKRAVSAPTTVNVEYVIVAGGGGGGAIDGGGGGAGGYRSSVTGESSGGGSSSESLFVATINENYNITIGAGGIGTQHTPGVGYIYGTNGNNSSAFDIISLGGGLGGIHLQNAGIGGSAGGAAGGESYRTNNTINQSGTTNQGFNGGRGAVNNGLRDSGGGGGGAGGQGVNGTANVNGGSGGIGVQSSITGIAKYYAGGGGGGGEGIQSSGGSGGSGGLGGGGNGGGTGSLNGFNGTANTGGGGGGSSYGAFTNIGGNGGSGVVIIRISSTANNVLIGSGLQYKDSNGVTQNGNGTRVAPSYTPSGYKVYEFVGGTGNIQF